ncbi:hypothetical protein SNEBB_010068, partial [Seison nebaliae]
MNSSSSSIEEVKDVHNCECIVTEAKVKALKIYQKSKLKLIEGEYSVSDAIQEVTSKCSSDVLENLPNLTSLKRALRNFKPKISPPNPKDINFPVPLELVSMNEESIVKYDKTENNERVMYFSITEALEELRKTDHLYMDGTFSVCPILVQQLYTISSRKGTLMYCLLPKKNKETYET